MIEKHYYHDIFIVEGKRGAYPFFLRDMNHPHPGVFLLADDFDDYTPHIVYLENSESVSGSVEKIMSNPQICDLLLNCFLGVALIQLPDDRVKMFCDVWENLGYIPKCNELLSYFSNSLSP
ncbi:hypothetical protein KJ742_00045 [Patescibacteria group bacterium]|nr:hypothetical protein [Patescibacteria group bacterium]